MDGVAVFGVTGRMGQALVRLLRAGPNSDAHPQAGQGARSDSATNAGAGSAAKAGAGAASAADAGAAVVGLTLSGATCAPGSARLGKDAAIDGHPTGILATDDVAAALRGAAVALDFSRPQLVAAHAAACAIAGVPLVVGTTGCDTEARAALDDAARSIPVLIAPNTSLGVAVMAQLVREAAVLLGSGFDVEILEAHHARKRDAPSGTALALGEVVAAARGGTLAGLGVFDRQRRQHRDPQDQKGQLDKQDPLDHQHGQHQHGSDSPREPGSIGFAVLRAGDIVGEHTVMFAAAGERIEITHRATDRAIFARGALRAAEWLVGRPPGLYGMQSVLGL